MIVKHIESRIALRSRDLLNIAAEENKMDNKWTRFCRRIHSYA